MQLSITRSQAKGFTGGVTFEVRAKLMPTAEEAQLISHYKLADQIVTTSHKRSGWTGTFKDVKIKDVVSGNTFKAKDLAEVIALQQAHAIPASRIMLMPEGRDSETLRTRERWLAQICSEHGFSLSDRLHIHLYGDTRGT